MENNTQALIDQRIKKLPPEVQKAIETTPWKQIISGIARTRNLNSDQLESLETETMLVIYGFEDPKSYLRQIVAEVTQDENLAALIVGDVSDMIFREISQKVEEAKKNPVSKNTLPELAPKNLPMVEEGEVVHDVPPMKPEEKVAIVQKPEAEAVKAPATREISEPPAKPSKLRPSSDKTDHHPVSARVHYEGGKDPYREPLV